MKHDPKKNQNLDWLKQDMSEDFKNRVLKSVLPELEKNKSQASPLSLNLNWIWSSLVAFAFVGLVTIRLTGWIESDSPSTTFDDIALLTPEEFEVVENLDLIEDLEKIDLEKIREEMKQKDRNS